MLRIILLAACAIAANGNAIANDAWTAREDVDKASGITSCVVKKNRVAFISITMPNGEKTVSLSPAERAYPGTIVYAHASGKRYNGEKRIILSDDSFRQITESPNVDISWTKWPSGTKQEETADMNGFAAASDCLR